MRRLVGGAEEAPGALQMEYGKQQGRDAGAGGYDRGRVMVCTCCHGRGAGRTSNMQAEPQACPPAFWGTEAIWWCMERARGVQGAAHGAWEVRQLPGGLRARRGGAAGGHACALALVA